jgi:hypothetical protein
MNVDIARLKIDIRSVESEIRSQKHLIKTTPLPWPTNLARPLRLLKEHATLLYSIAAHRRHRLHMTRCTRRHAHLGLPKMELFTIDDQARFIGERWRQYAPVGEAA